MHWLCRGCVLHVLMMLDADIINILITYDYIDGDILLYYLPSFHTTSTDTPLVVKN